MMTGLLHYEWPYNVRELEACIKRSVALADGPLLTEQLLPETVLDAMKDYASPATEGALRSAAPQPRSWSPAAPDAEQLKELLARHQGNVAAVGRELGKARMQVHRWMKKHNIDIDDFRS